MSQDNPLISEADKAALEALTNHRRPVFEPGTVSVGPIGIEIEPGDYGWTVIGAAHEDGIQISPIEKESDERDRIPAVHPRIMARQGGKNSITRITQGTLPPELSQFMRDLIQEMRTAPPPDDREYLLDRLNTRLRGEDPGPYETDRMRRAWS